MEISSVNTYTATASTNTTQQVERGGGDVIVSPRPKSLEDDTVSISSAALELQRGGGDVIVSPRPK
ncbi:hypothetical protein [Pseudoalteromonas phage KB12-38]|nr:hypothetical protein [Pseudoalteromonas phage KB12-38]